MPSIRSIWAFSLVLLAVWLLPPLATAEDAANGGVGDSSAAPVDVTILQTVNLPWQAPEVIVTTQAALEELRVEVRVDSEEGPVQQLHALPAGATRSLTWSAAVGPHRCAVRVSGRSAAGSFTREWNADVTVTAPLQVSFKPADVDLAARKLRFVADGHVSLAELSIFDMDGKSLHQASTRITSGAPGKHISLSWPALSEPAARIALRVFGSSDTWADVEWTPIQIEIPHAPIYFDDTFASAAIGGGKLAAAYEAVRLALREHAHVPGLRLYVLGLSGAQSNAEYAAERANAVASYLRARGGIALPILSGASTDASADAATSGDVQAILAVEAPTQSDWVAVSGARKPR